jgi:hypothetical protein
MLSARRSSEFSTAACRSGSVAKSSRRSMSPNGKMRVFLAQRASAKEGISLHDVDGTHQRVFIDLGIPGRPTDAIQSEGRIYRARRQEQRGGRIPGHWNELRALDFRADDRATGEHGGKSRHGRRRPRAPSIVLYGLQRRGDFRTARRPGRRREEWTKSGSEWQSVHQRGRALLHEREEDFAQQESRRAWTISLLRNRSVSRWSSGPTLQPGEKVPRAERRPWRDRAILSGLDQSTCGRAE